MRSGNACLKTSRRQETVVSPRHRVLVDGRCDRRWRFGGFGSVSKADGKENEQILRTMVYPEFDFVSQRCDGCTNKIEKALDVGAGVGRVSVRAMNFVFFVSRLFSFFF